MPQSLTAAGSSGASPQAAGRRAQGRGPLPAPSLGAAAGGGCCCLGAWRWHAPAARGTCHGHCTGPHPGHSAWPGRLTAHFLTPVRLVSLLRCSALKLFSCGLLSQPAGPICFL